jgi:hypothetical protein
MNLDDEESLRIILSIIEILRFAQNDKRERAQNDRNEGPSSVSQ